MSIKFTWYGHAVIGLEVGRYQLLVDPYLTDNPAATIKPASVQPDFILISHGHGDHVGDAIAIAKRAGATVISNFEIANWFQAQGIQAHGQQPRRRLPSSVRLSQAHAGFAWIRLARRIVWRQSVGLSAHRRG